MAYFSWSNTENIIKDDHKECFGENVCQCIKLGENAAEEIAGEFCSMRSKGGRYSNYEKECREEAYVICEGSVGGKACELCPDVNLGMGDLQKI